VDEATRFYRQSILAKQIEKELNRGSGGMFKSPESWAKTPPLTENTILLARAEYKKRKAYRGTNYGAQSNGP